MTLEGGGPLPGAAPRAGGRACPAGRRVPWQPMLLLVVLGLAALPVARMPGPAMPAITVLFATGLLMAELCTGFLLLVRFQGERTAPLLVLGATCVFSATMAVAHLLTFQGALLPGRSVWGTPSSTAWVFLSWVTAKALLSLVAVVLEARGPPPLAPGTAARALPLALVLSVGAATGILLLAVQAAPSLPPLLAGPSWTGLNQALSLAAIACVGLAVVVVLAGRRSPLFDWVALSLTAQGVALVLSHAAGGRFSIGWTVGRLFWLLAACLLLLHFLGEFVRQQAQLRAATVQLEARVAARTKELRDALGERSLLLREVYHRVKNNLQTVDALLAMEARRLPETGAQDALRRLRERIQTLGLVHAQLMASADHETLDLAAFLLELAAKLRDSAGALRLEVVAAPMRAGMDLAVPLGLVVTELVTNAVKHAAARPGAGPLVQVQLEWESTGGAVLTVRDHGGDAGAPERLAESRGLGLRLVRGLVRQLDARMAVEWRGGTRIAIHIPPRRGLEPPPAAPP